MDSEAHTDKARILVVEDENVYIDLLAELLREDYQVTVAKSGEDGLRRARGEAKPDLILLDWLMPGMNGLDVCRALKDTPGTAAIPVIFLTVKSDIDDEIRGFEAGAVDYITKPLSPPVVMARIRTHLALANQRQVLEQLVEERTRKIAALHTEALRDAEELERRVRRRTVELEALNRELEAFSYSVSHDLRAPLRAINGFSQVLLDDCADRLDAEGRDYLMRIRTSGQRMDELINDLLELSRVSRSELSVEPLELDKLVEAVAEQKRQSEPKRAVAVDVQSPIVVNADARLLRIVIENLLDNAWKFSSTNEKAHIAFGSESVNGRQEFFLRDNGVGFDQAYADKMFDPFQRLHSSDEFPGTGIGLATVKRVISRHGGDIWAKSEQGRGTEFRFTLGVS